MFANTILYEQDTECSVDMYACITANPNNISIIQLDKN